MTIEEFINKSAKSIMVYRFARADIKKNSGAQTRMKNAEKELDKLIREYVEKNRPYNISDRSFSL